MTPVTLISYYFPPIGMSGSARAYGLFRYLPEFGFQPHVITVKDIAYPAHDNTLLSQQDDEHITRTGSLDPSRALRILGRENLEFNGGGRIKPPWIAPDYKALWAPFAKSAAKRMLRGQKQSLIITTSPPPSIHSIGVYLSQHCDCRWLADFRDMWLTRPIEDCYNAPRQVARSHALLSLVKERASDIVAVNDSIAKYIGAQTVIPNGADPTTFGEWDKHESTDKIFRIGYLGASEEAGATETFVVALKEALNRCNLHFDDCRVLYVGAVERSMLKRVYEKYSLSNLLEFHEYATRKGAIKRLRSADVLLVTVSDERLPHVTTSKVFDYLVSGKNIIGIAPEDGELAQLLNREGEACFNLSQERALADSISERVLLKRAKGKVARVEGAVLERRRKEYSWRTMAQRIAQRLERL